MILTFRSALLLLAVTLGACAHAPSHAPADPLEVVNRSVFAFNTKTDKYLLRPAARAYTAVVPGFARTGVRNFFANLATPVTIVNQYLQGKFAAGTSDLGRLLINSSLGLGGMLDVASYWGLPAHDEDFGQTLGRWGVGEGWYLMLPFLGPSTNRDLVSRIARTPFNPLYYVEDTSLVWGLTVLDGIQDRAQYLNADALLSGQLDPYIFLRSAYLQRRWTAIHDGRPPLEQSGFEEFDDF